MSRSWLEDAFAHHTWATLRLIDTCGPLSTKQLETPAAGAYGSILDTLRYIVGSDSFYLFVASGERTPLAETDEMSLPGLRAAMESNGSGWSQLLARDLDPDSVLREVDADDGYQREAPLGIRLAQALHHGNDHRSQVSVALTALGIEPPGISVWDFGHENGRVVEVMPASGPAAS